MAKTTVNETTKKAAKQEQMPTVAQSAKQYLKVVPKIKKRDGTIVPFDFVKIVTALERAMAAAEEGSHEEASLVAHQVVGELVQMARKYKNILPEVEGVQDSIERHLILNEYVKASKAFILYRDKRSKMRDERVEVPEHVQKLAAESKKYFKNNPLGEFVYLRTYARWIPEEGRRETWVETVDRYINFMQENLGNKLSKKEYDEVRQAILEQKVMPSMRMLQFAGDPARRCNTCAYNCSFIAPSKLEDFPEIMYLSMQGCGVGFSVEGRSVEQLPQIEMQTGEKLPTHVIGDSKEGWCDALVLGLKTWYAGKDISFDYSKIRPAGARLKTMGGKASGPEPLQSLLGFARERVLERQGRRLRTLDVHDLICKIGECVVAGGVRRSAMISLSDLDDIEMRHAKDGQYYLTNPQRGMANNSAIYNRRPTNTELMDEWVALMKSGSGERGIFNRGGLVDQLPKRRVDYWTETGYIQDGVVTGPAGTNPCGEIILKSKQFCNLSEVVARANDTKETLLEKVRLATLLGTYQSSLTNFKYISQEWTDNCETERLLGVSITGQWDSDAARDGAVLDAMRKEAIKANKKYAKKLGIPTSNAITCVKPSGTVSQTIDSSSGMHPRHAKYYIRRIRISATDSLFKMMKDQGVPYHPEVGQTMEDANTFVIEFPVQAPKGAVVKDDLTALDQLTHWKVVKENFTEHNPSVTVSVGNDEWISVVNWVDENWPMVGGLSFLPRNDHVYRLAPYEECDKDTFERLSKNFEGIDYSKLYEFERKDETEMKKELACVSGTCDII